MIISTHKYRPTKKDGKLNKTQAMFDCCSNFKRQEVNTLDELYAKLYSNVVYAPIYWEDNYRKKENALLTIDLLMFDIDDGKTIDEVLDSPLGQQYEIMCLKTASWTPELEKFRVFIPLKNPISFEKASHYREFYKILNEQFELEADENTMEAGRGYIAVKGREAFISEATDWLDLAPFYDKFIMKVKHKLQKAKWRQEKADEETKAYRRKHNIKVPTSAQIQSDRKFRELASDCGTGENYSAVYKLLGYCKWKGQTASEAADSVMYLNLDGEYSDKDDLENKYQGLK